MATRRTPKSAALATPPVTARRRVVVAEPEHDDDLVEPSYFASGLNKGSLKFVSSGCAVIDEALGGGYVLGRVANIVGDKSAGKTLSAMEIIANFCRDYPEGWVRYGESEAAFDEPYAEALGIPVDRIEFNAEGQPLETVENLYQDMTRCLDKHKGTPGVYIIDSLDALSDEAEMRAEFNEASFGGAKPKAIGQLFRRLVQRLEDQEVLFVVVSQIRDVMNAKPFQETKKRSGGKALDFYATHIVWLTEIKKLKRTIAKIERVIGIDVRANVRKNKIGLAYRTVDYPLLFGYGIDDLTASVEWLIDNERTALLEPLGMSKTGYAVLLTAIRNRGGEEVADLRAKLTALVRREWAAIETTFLPKSRKY